jgi:glycosidase
MLRFYIMLLGGMLCGLHSISQILTSSPVFPTANDTITVFYNVQSGNAGIPFTTIPIYTHTGVVTQEDVDNCQNNWQYVQGNWGQADPNVLMTPMGNGMHKITIYPPTYYGYPEGLEIGRLMFVFRNASGSFEGKNADGSDIWLDLYPEGFHAKILSPTNSNSIATAGQNIVLNAATSENAVLALYVNDVLVASAEDAASLEYNFSETQSGTYTIRFEADHDGELAEDIKTIAIDPQPAIAASPAGTRDGINYIDDSSVRLQLFAPHKDFIYVIGDFNNWEIHPDYLMNRTPDGQTYWLDITNLDPDVLYRFQYSIDAEDLRVADAYSELVLDPWNDRYISENVYPNLPSYPTCGTNQVVSTFKINSDDFAWTDQSFVRTPKERLVIYELLVRDFVHSRSYQAVIDTLDYLQQLGVTAIELMPINEFEGNDSWGYNGTFFFAPDKAYGSANDLKAFVNECHSRGIAVILDIALNHAFGQNPFVRMYFDADAGEWGQPTADNPWFNEIPRHDFNVGYDFNHESPHTRNFCKRVLAHWLNEYHIDGYRFDLSKGFTQNNTLGNIGAWNAYDQSRVNILTDYYQHIQQTKAGAYVVLEHLSGNSEETALANAGMMLWGNLNHEYTEAAMGFGANLSWGSYVNRGWSNPHLVTYAESHDEERMMYKNLQFGNSNGSYNVRNLNTGLDRSELAHAFLIPIPGPKMIWQFAELGYDYSINYCSNGTISDGCRTSAKPIRWDYDEVIERYKLYQVVSALNHLKRTEPLFSTTNFSTDLSGMAKRIHLNGSNKNAVVAGNFNVTAMTVTPGFQHAGTWYDYFSGEAIEVTTTGQQFTYQPGEYHLYFDQAMQGPDTGTVDLKEVMQLFDIDFLVYPNPASDKVIVGLQLPTTSTVHLEIIDIMGSVLKVETETVSSGNQVIHFDTSALPAGVYILRCSTGQFQGTTRLVIRK